MTALVAVAAALVAGVVGERRLTAIDAGALRAKPGADVTVEGAVASVPRRDGGTVSFGLESEAGRVLVRTEADTGELPVGSMHRVSGRLSEPEPWRAAALARHGIAMALDAERVEPLSGWRGGLAGAVDRIRLRAERALERGIPDRESALARGFVLGQDDRIDAATREDFRRSGLAHLLAVSGQNVLLLCLLAWPFLALAGLTLRARLLALLVLIAVYVPVTGAGPSIQRAAVMGAAGLVAALAERPASRWGALAFAAIVTLALNPRIAGDVGWQLSFAAVAGILLWCGRFAALLAGGAPQGSPRRAVAEGIAMTVAATVATAPLMAHHFDSLSLAALPANVLALPAVAPAMWLGMLSAAAGQVPAIPVEPLNWLNSLCLAYIAQIARWLGSPRWAQVQLGLGGPGQVAVAYAVLLALAELGLAAASRRAGLGAGAGGRGLRRLGVAAAVLAAAALVAGPAAGGASRPGDANRLVVRVLDVGQGDAILLDPPEAPPVLVDTGPPDGGAAERLRELGVSALGAVVVTHGDSDHDGGLADVLSAAPAGRVLRTLPEGGEVRAGELRLTALWPPRELVRAGSGVEANQLSVVLLAEWRHFSMLLAADAEAEAVPLDPGPIDVLKVAHHGSEDAGLENLLERTVPHLAVISVGEDNGYGHPAPETIAELGSHHLPVLRTDDDGDVVIRADDVGWWVED